MAEKGVKLVFLRRKDQYSNKGPFDAGVPWQPAFIVEMDCQEILGLVDLDQGSFSGNPLMPIF